MKRDTLKPLTSGVPYLSVIAICIASYTLFLAILLVPATLWFCFIPGAGGDFDFIGLLLMIPTFPVFFVFWPIVVIATIGLATSIIALFIHQDKHLSLIALAMGLCAICIFFVCNTLLNLKV